MAGKVTILVVDDDEKMLEFLRAALEQAGYFVTTAGDAAQALIQAEGLKPRLIITDILMPTWGTGLDAYKSIRTKTKLKDVPVVFITGMSPEKAKALMPPDPKVRLIAKPVNLILLEQAIQELTGEERPLSGG